MKKYIVFIILWSVALSVQAAPLQYNFIGEMRIDINEWEPATGSFVLSDPTVTIYDATDSRGNYVSLFTVTDFSLESASYSLTQTEYSYFRVAFGP